MEKFNCDCGFSWVKGFSGQHNCSPYYRETIDSLKTQVERYQKLVCQTCDGHGAVGNILDSMDCPDCLAHEKRVQVDAIESVKPIVTEELREVFDSEMLEQMKSNGVIACKDGFLLSLIATFEMIIEDHANKLKEQNNG